MKQNKKTHLVVILILVFIGIPFSCTVFKDNSATPKFEIDPVCGMKVDKSEAYTYKYNDKKYYFDNYNCKEAFKMNPEKFINNKCVEIK